MLICAILGASLAASLVVSLLMSRVYESKATILTPRENGPGGMATGIIMSTMASAGSGLAMPSLTPHRDLFVSVLRARRMADEVAKRLNLAQIYRTPQPEDAAALRRRRPRDRTGDGRRRTGARRVRQVGHVEPGVRGPGAEVRRQQRVGGLVRRKVRCNVENQAGAPTCASRNSRNVRGTAPSSVVANARNRSSRSKNASSSPWVLL